MNPKNFSRAPRQSVPFTAVRIQDAFWSPKQRVYREQTIPHSWQYVRREIEDNEIAAGWRSGARGEDTPWNQANLHKVLETVAYALAQERDPTLDKKTDDIIRAIAGAQQPNGYVNALITVRKMTPWANLDSQHDGYVAGHLIEAAVAHYVATGKRSFLTVARRLADHIHRRFCIEGHGGVCGHAELELALVRLFGVTGERRYLELARNWIERRGKPQRSPSSNAPRSYFMDHLPIRQVPEVTGHAVRALFYLAGVAGVAAETGDAGLARAARRLWHSTTRRKMYVTGSVGSQETDEGFGPDYDLPRRAYAESCAACGLIYFAHALFLLDGAGDSMDVLERVLYNAALHGISLDGTSTYYRNPLTDENNPRNNIWVCCPPCLSRTLLRVQDYVYAVGGGAAAAAAAAAAEDVYVNLYVGSTATISLARGSVVLIQETNHPWQGAVRLTLRPQKAVSAFRLRLRVPGWCRGVSVRINGQVVPKPPQENGYIVLARRWQHNDVVELDLPLPVERVEAHPLVKENNGLVAVQRGPVVYGFEALDNEGRVDMMLPADPQFQAAYRPDLLGGVTVLTGRDAGGAPVTAVPFYALANRARSKQVVWVRQAETKTAGPGWDDNLYRSLPSAAPPKR